MARTLVRSGAADCVLVVGFEQMQPGAINEVWTDRPSPMGLSTRLMEETRGKHDSPRNAQFFGNAGREYMEQYVLRSSHSCRFVLTPIRYGAAEEDFAEIGRISHEHSQRNPYAQFKKEYTLQEIKDSGMIYSPLTKLQCSPTSDGAGAAVIVSEEFLRPGA